jgi:biotin carboxyl carrier protein
MSITYQDVRIVLALIDGQDRGTARFEQDDLALTVQVGADAERPHELAHSRLHAVRSPGVGVFQRLQVGAADAPKSGARVGNDTVIATILSVGRETPVVAGADGWLSEFAVKEGDFVEYGQTLTTIEEKT